MFSWVELLLARTLTTVSAKPISAMMTRTVSAAGMDWGLLAAAGVLTIIPGALVIWFVRNYIARASRSVGCRWRVDQNNTVGLPFTSPRLPGEVGAKRRVRGAIRGVQACRESPSPHPLPAGGERESRSDLLFERRA